MKTVFRILLMICCCLLGGRTFASRMQTAQHLGQVLKQQEVNILVQHNKAMVKVAADQTLPENFYDEEDDDDVQLYGKWLPFMVVLACFSLPFNPFCILNKLLPNCQYLSGTAQAIYLQQRVLRI